MKITTAIFVTLLCLASIGANACPKGQHPYGGIGPHHKGGWCAP